MSILWLKTAKNQKYSHIITVKSDGIEMAIFCKSIEERREKVIKIQETGMIFDKCKAYVSGVFKVD